MSKASTSSKNLRKLRPTPKLKQNSSARLQALRAILTKGVLATQEELRHQLLEEGYSTTQTTVSRDLRRLGAAKMQDESGQTVYRLLGNEPQDPISEGFKNAWLSLILEMNHNGTMIVIRTEPGSASLVARELDNQRPAGILGTIAGDDTVFVAPPKTKNLDKILAQLENFFLTKI